MIARCLTGKHGDRYDGDTETFIADTLTSGSHPGSNMPGRRREDDYNLAVTHSLTSEGHDASEDGTGRGTPLAIAYQCHGSNVGPMGTLRQGGSIARDPFLATGTAAVRRLTPRECERLQGFPDDWTALGPDSRRYAALGDAVTVNVSEWIGRRILEHERRAA